MSVFYDPKYDDCCEWVNKSRSKGVSWEQIRMGKTNGVKELSSFLKNRVEMDYWPDMTVEEWMDFVDYMEDNEAKQQDIRFKGNDGALFDKSQDNGLQIPTNERSSWQLYKKSLNWKKESIDDLEQATLGILRRLNNDTRTTGPVKGLVVGHVQSGKTANMEALMAMAADHGWNMFIVLSGTIENLRLQTLRRMQKDLNQNGNLVWIGIEHPSKKINHFGNRTIDLNFGTGAIQRYFTVCLKNTGRLKNLIDWIHADKASHNQMKILIIDDEADQASISNTAVEYRQVQKERKGINKLIVNLVQDIHYKSETNTNGKATAINYVMYTATPYANFLNECVEDSLYPKDFIWTLKTSDEYIGPNQIFGDGTVENPDGLDIKRVIDDNDLNEIAEIYEGNITEPPQSLKDSICWFICAAAVLRYRGYKKPISMLVHTSQKQVCHEVVANIVSKWINATRKNGLIEACRNVYEYETNRITKDVWYNSFSKYGIPKEEISDYPLFDKIITYINVLLDENIKHIKMNEEGDLTYHKGLHLVIDNCSKNGIQNENDYVRLAYPDPDAENYPSPAPAFIIVGGSTLSRGLTIEGLVSTFFLRASCQCDTLMQMGRWFGYRKGYELLPRLWMTQDTIDKFEFLSLLEVELREDLKTYMDAGVRPDEYGPRIKESPKVSWLRITSRNHMRNAVAAEMNFSGAKPQTVFFDNDVEIQKKNISITESFINSIPGNPQKSYYNNALVWKNVPLDIIMNELLIDKFRFSDRTRVFNEINTFCEWLKQVMSAETLNKWSVIVAGKGNVVQINEEDKSSDDKFWRIKDYYVEKVNRSKKKMSSDDSYIDIGVLRSLKDMVSDVDDETLKNCSSTIQKQSDVDKIRREGKVENIPQLVIYRIYGKSKVYGADNTVREDLNFDSDIMGIHIYIPGEQINTQFCKKLTIRLPEKDIEDEVEENA